MRAMKPSTSPGVTFPKIILLPNGWQPEGIASGSGTSFYVGSLADGAISRATSALAVEVSWCRANPV